MKKLFLTLALVAIGSAISFAQSSGDAESGKLEIERLSNTAETSAKKKIDITELPLQVQEALQQSAYRDWEIAEIYEIEEEGRGWVDEDIPLEEGQTAASLISDFSYEIVMLNQDLEDEIEDSRETISDEQEVALEEETAISTETVKIDVPAIILHYDEEGKLLKKEGQEDSAPEDTKN